MKKIKQTKLKLKPSARDNRRYFIVFGKNEDIEKAILDYIGILGMAKSAYMKIKEDNGKLIGSCKRESLNDVQAGLALAGFKIEKVSGTLKGLK